MFSLLTDLPHQSLAMSPKRKTGPGDADKVVAKAIPEAVRKKEAW